MIGVAVHFRRVPLRQVAISNGFGVAPCNRRLQTTARNRPLRQGAITNGLEMAIVNRRLQTTARNRLLRQGTKTDGSKMAIGNRGRQKTVSKSPPATGEDLETVPKCQILRFDAKTMN